MALQALECVADSAVNPMENRQAIKALRAALAVPDAMQIGWYNTIYNNFHTLELLDKTSRLNELLASGEIVPVYAGLAPALPVVPDNPLTPDRIAEIYKAHYPDSWMADGSFLKFARAIEMAHGIDEAKE